MVQDSGADSLQLDIVIQTIAKLQGIEQTAAKLQALSQVTGRARNALGQYTKETLASAEATRETQGALSEILTKGFSPKFIGSVQGVNSALLTAGKTFQNYTKTATASNAISGETANKFSQLSQRMIAVGVTGQATLATFDAFSSQLAKIQPQTEAGKAGVKALSDELGILKLQFIEAGNAAEQRFNKPLSQSQKAGQGLLLSFSISQLAAGRLSQAMFGLGFAILFTGTKFLNFTTITVALGAALASIALDRIVAGFKKADTVTEQVSKSMERFNLALDEAKGKSRLLVEEFRDLIQSEEDLFIGFDKLINRIENPPDFDSRAVNELEQELLKVARAGGDVEQAFLDIVGLSGELGELFLINTKGSVSELNNLSAAVQGLKLSASEALSSFQRDIDRAAELKILLDPFEIDRENIDRTFNILSNFSQIHFDELNDIVRDGLENQIETRRNALQGEQDIIRESLRVETEIIRDVVEEQIRVRQRLLEDQLSVIRDGYEAEIDIIKDALDREMDIIREQSATAQDAIRDDLAVRIKIIKDAASNEIDVEKDKISEIKKQEQELSRSLQALRSERSKITAAIIGSEAELAALERESRRIGVDTTEEQSIIRARIKGLQAEGNAVDKTTAKKEKERESLKAQIKVIEDVIDAIEDARDKAVDAAKDAADAQVKAAKDAADDEIKIAKDAADDKIDVINDTRDAAIRAAEDIADKDIREAQRAASGVIREAQRAATAAERAASTRSTEEIKSYQETADAQIEENNRAHDNAIFNFEEGRDSALKLVDIEKEKVKAADELAEIYRNEILPLLKEMAEIQTPFTGGSLDQFLAEQKAIQRAFIKMFFPDADAAFFKSIGLGFQFGGIVPGPIGKPQLAVVHGGEEVISPSKQLTAGRPVQVTFNITVRNEGDIKKISRMVNKELGVQTRTNIRTSRGLR